jgi:hypothetical protein
MLNEWAERITSGSGSVYNSGYAEMFKLHKENTLEHGGKSIFPVQT